MRNTRNDSAIDPFRVNKRPLKDSGVIASLSSFAVGEVVVAGNVRYIITEEISKEQFNDQLAANHSRPSGVSGNMDIKGSVGLTDTFSPSPEPEFDAEHFYRCRVELARQP